MTAQSGTISWFGGPQDKTTGPTTASGAPVTQPGIAVYNRATLGGWWLLKLPNGKLTMIQQTDIGPAPSSGRKFDFTYSALPALGYSTSNFPTNANVSGVYLGKSSTDIERSLAGGAASDLGANVPNIAGWLKLVSSKPQFGVTPAGGSSIGPFDTGALDTGNKAVQPGGPSTLGNSIPQAITDVFNQAVKDAKYGAVTAAAIVIGVLLIYRAFSGGGSSEKVKVVPV